ncbi:Ubl carboxyl-terminal hydrolase 18 [Lonchura striata]|uniref:Ubl carboxyl-terminal hydrolase 18 n=1 Tax=Lonchura striata TaxID=40157 RepID=A0A218V0M3_9PASE|nr:Ubl carboxyl-terminal hydrolase 18 [Lonchura striata domestica]
MGQTSGRQETNKKPEVAPSEIMEAEIEIQNNKEETKEVKAKNQKLTSVFGLADLKNEAIGLYNLGQSSCLNSLLQVFLMNICFTRILRRITVPPSPAQRRNDVPYQMLLLLEKMQCGKCKAVGPTDLACCLSEHRVKLFVQHDAAQLFLTLWNLLKKQMKKPELVKELSDLYTICIQEHLACQKCSFEVKNNSTMLTLPLPVLDANSHRLKTLTGEVGKGLNHIKFERRSTTQICQDSSVSVIKNTDTFSPVRKKVLVCPQFSVALLTVSQSMKLTHLPQTLALHLKRFCFEKSSRTHKLSLHLPFPQELDLREVLTESQCQADDSEKATWQFELFAVVAHSGLSSCGHYCAYIRSLTDCKWYCFNDSEVCQVSWDDVKCTYGHSNLYWYANVSLIFANTALDFGMRVAKRGETNWFGNILGSSGDAGDVQVRISPHFLF